MENTEQKAATHNPEGIPYTAKQLKSRAKKARKRAAKLIETNKAQAIKDAKEALKYAIKEVVPFIGRYRRGDYSFHVADHCCEAGNYFMRHNVCDWDRDYTDRYGKFVMKDDTTMKLEGLNLTVKLDVDGKACFTEEPKGSGLPEGYEGFLTSGLPKSSY